MMQPETVTALLAELAGASAEEVLAAAATRFPGRVAFASSLGLEDQVLTAMIAEAKLDIPIFTLDTGRLYPETYGLIDRTSKRYGMTVHVYFPAAGEVEEMVDGDGVNLFRDSVEARKRCCDIRKVRPLRRAQRELDAWICGLRSGQGATRQKVEAAEWDDAGLVKINPLAAWDEAGVWDYVRAHDVPYNARSGRWWWESAEQRECGLHHRSGPRGAAS
jgi:phosphoadenosine phosphosulfate reductase